jgi:Metallo-peptidase family M12
MILSRISTGLVVALGLFAGCSSSEPDVLTYEEFSARAYQEPDTGFRIFNGDELVETDEAMQALYQGYLDSIADAAAREEGLAVVSQGLIVNTVGGADDKWPASTAQNLTYCIDQASFGANYSTVVSAMNSAASAWESASGGGVNFVHMSSLDGNCSSRTSSVVFNLRQVTTNQYLARAFFPSTSRKGREILVAKDTFGNIKPWSPAGVLRHEVGHTIGFRHEHTRPESGTCFENSQWRALTGYDSGSVMHYPQCNGSNSGDLNLTNADKSGAAALY